jgi:hypothetical protein
VSAGITTIGLLTPAHPLVGTWKTSFLTTFAIYNDFDSPDLEFIGTIKRQMTWIITPSNNPNEFDVEVHFVDSDVQITPNKGYVPNVSPMFLKGVLSGDTFTIIREASMFQPESVVCIFSYTETIMTGTWDYIDQLIYTQEEKTAPNGLTLNKV